MTSIPGPDSIARREFPNGMTVLVRENFSSPSVVIDGLLRVGGVDNPPHQAGLSSFTSACLMRGTERRTFQQIYEEIESIGATVDVGGGLNTSGFGAKSLAEDLPVVIDILADVLQHPTFPAADVEKERGEILTDLEERINDTRRMAGLTFRKLLYPADHPYSRSLEGYPETLQAITRDDLVNFYRSRYGANGMIVSIVGAVKAEAAFEVWERAFGAWHGADGASQRLPLPPAPQVTEVRREFAPVPGKTQSDVLLGFVGPARREPDYWDAALCNTVLGVFGLMGRLGQNVRDKLGLAYYSYSRVDGGLGPGPWAIAAGVNPANVERAVEAMRAEIRRIRDKTVGGKELADNKAFVTGSLPLRLETNDGVAGVILDMELYGLGLDYLERYKDMIYAITPKRIQAAAQKYLDPDHFALAIAGPEAK
jgi:zinc protease